MLSRLREIFRRGLTGELSTFRRLPIGFQPGAWSDKNDVYLLWFPEWR